MLDFIKLLEGKNKSQNIEIIPLNFAPSEVSSVMSKATLDLHYEKLAKGYAKRFNNNEGDKDFNYAGVFLHNLWFTQFRKIDLYNKPNGPIKGFIERNYGSFDSFKDKFEEVAMGIQGSGWVYLSYDGNIKTIKNHEVKSDILFIVDWWEHAFILDYGSDKKRYLKDIWKIINWNVISTRLGKSWQK